MATELSYSEARQNLASVLDRAVHDREPVVIKRRGSPNAVVIAEDDLRQLLETAHQLRSPTNARRLLEALDRSQRGEVESLTLDELRSRVGLEA